MTQLKDDLRVVMKDAHAHFFMLRGDQTIMLRLWEIKEDAIVIDMPRSASMHKTVLGLVPTLDGSSVYEIDGEIDSEDHADQMRDTLRVRVDPAKVKRVNRRLLPRVSFTPPVDTVIIVAGGDRSVVGRVVNLSAGGLRVETLEELPPDKKLTFRFEVEVDDEIHVLQPVGSVVYELPGDTGHVYGIKFEMSDDGPSKNEEAAVETIEKTVDLIALVNKLIVRK